MKNLYLTDRQYLDLMKSIRADLNKIIEVMAEDSTQIGYKHTVSNVGLCAGTVTDGNWSKDKYVSRETAMWPKEFDKIGKVRYENPQMFTMKYRDEGHRCPLDTQKTPKRFVACGCFYRCLLFSKKFRTLTIEEIKQMYDKQITLTERVITERSKR